VIKFRSTTLDYFSPLPITSSEGYCIHLSTAAAREVLEWRRPANYSSESFANPEFYLPLTVIAN
jgi:hypothetical protein